MITTADRPYHITPGSMVERVRHLEKRLHRQGVAEHEIREQVARLRASNPPLLHHVRDGEIVCGRALTAEEFATLSTNDPAKVTCARCQAAPDTDEPLVMADPAEQRRTLEGLLDHPHAGIKLHALELLMLLDRWNAEATEP